ncbi:hypothetical protein JOD45_000102 [Scopulibacillus daqui]|uniref:Anti-sigma factor n=1 Tax=Scopulibacillus daqui TaxID=1469162 RepID=A0ABS2PVK2_9BACL|nr:zf-HC2 domain-containing protein [Scopulibacillus daqui]MBM7643911.1 hypothetical protein [Scopulibacillus daqui]
MRADCHWPEEELVDYVLGNLENGQRLKEHLQFCESCQRKIVEWQKVLSDDSYESFKPSAKVKWRIKWTAKHSKGPSGKRDALLQKPWAMATGFLCFILFSLILDKTEIHSFASKTGIFNGQQAVLRNISTKAVPDHNSQVDSYALINRKARETTIYVDGLKPMRGNEYQVWYIANGQKKNAGVLKLNQGIGRMHIKHKEIDKFDHIFISSKPKDRNSTANH